MPPVSFADHIATIGPDSAELEDILSALRDRETLRNYAQSHGLSLTPEQEARIFDEIEQMQAANAPHPLSDEDVSSVAGGKISYTSTGSRIYDGNGPIDWLVSLFR